MIFKIKKHNTDLYNTLLHLSRNLNFYNKMNMSRISNTKLDYLNQNNYSKGYIYKSTKEYLEGLIN